MNELLALSEEWQEVVEDPRFLLLVGVIATVIAISVSIIGFSLFIDKVGCLMPSGRGGGGSSSGGEGGGGGSSCGGGCGGGG